VGGCRLLERGGALPTSTYASPTPTPAPAPAPPPQVCGGYPDAMARVCQVVSDAVSCDFVDLNCGCPIDTICSRQAGSALLTKPRRFEEVVRAAAAALDVPLIVKMR